MPVDWEAHMRRVVHRLVHESETYTIRPANGAAAYAVPGIYAEPYAELLAGEAAGIAGSRPRFSAMADELGPVVRGDLLDRAQLDDEGQVVAVITYRIAALEPATPSGLVVVQLEK